MNWKIAAIWVAVGLYAVSPVDFIPDVVPILGFMDDLALLVGAAIATKKTRKA